MTDTNPRSLIQRLADDLGGITEELVIPEYAHTEKERTDASLALVAEARTYLDQPKPEGPTDIEIASILKAYAVVEPQMGASRILHEKHFSNAARAVLARWGK